MKFYDWLLVNGAWSVWSEYSPCSVTCGFGTKVRMRTCTNPKPENNGADCTGVRVETEECDLGPCNCKCNSRKKSLRSVNKSHSEKFHKVPLYFAKSSCRPGTLKDFVVDFFLEILPSLLRWPYLRTFLSECFCNCNNGNSTVILQFVDSKVCVRIICRFSPFVPNTLFLYPLNTSENLRVFWCFQGVEKRCIGNKWVNPRIICFEKKMDL